MRQITNHKKYKIYNKQKKIKKIYYNNLELQIKLIMINYLKMLDQINKLELI